MKMMTLQHTGELDQALLRLPFDQYGRYSMIREALDAARPLVGERLQILDVGGYFRTFRGVEILPARAFLPDDDVTVLDQHASDLPGYVRGDGRGLDYADSAFDFVISCDTLEHIPSPDRPAFWRELLRVARYGVVLAAPFASLEVVAAEDLLFRYIKAELGLEQMQLKEHRDYGLPDLATTHVLLDDMGLSYRTYPSGYVHAWLAMMVAKHYLYGRTSDHDLHERLDEYYSRFFAAEERCEPAYRHLLLVQCDGRGEWLAAADATLLPTIRDRPALGRPAWPELAGWFLHLVDLGLADRQREPLNQTIAAQNQQIALLHQMLAQRDAQVADLAARAGWLEQQSADARRALAAVEGGRVVRLLNWLSRLRSMAPLGSRGARR
jgi:hypothetical protein